MKATDSTGGQLEFTMFVNNTQNGHLYCFSTSGEEFAKKFKKIRQQLKEKQVENSRTKSNSAGLYNVPPKLVSVSCFFYILENHPKSFRRLLKIYFFHFLSSA
jgi:hypothetical protein